MLGTQWMPPAPFLSESNMPPFAHAHSSFDTSVNAIRGYEFGFANYLSNNTIQQTPSLPSIHTIHNTTTSNNHTNHTGGVSCAHLRTMYPAASAGSSVGRNEWDTKLESFQRGVAHVLTCAKGETCPSSLCRATRRLIQTYATHECAAKQQMNMNQKQTMRGANVKRGHRGCRICKLWEFLVSKQNRSSSSSSLSSLSSSSSSSSSSRSSLTALGGGMGGGPGGGVGGGVRGVRGNHSMKIASSCRGAGARIDKRGVRLGASHIRVLAGCKSTIERS